MLNRMIICVSLVLITPVLFLIWCRLVKERFGHRPLLNMLVIVKFNRSFFLNINLFQLLVKSWRSQTMLQNLVLYPKVLLRIIKKTCLFKYLFTQSHIHTSLDFSLSHPEPEAPPVLVCPQCPIRAIFFFRFRVSLLL